MIDYTEKLNNHEQYIKVLRSLKQITKGISINELKEHMLEIKGVINVHHIQIWSIDGFNNYATMRIVTNGKNRKLKELVKEELSHHRISHTTIELEA